MRSRDALFEVIFIAVDQNGKFKIDIKSAGQYL